PSGRCRRSDPTVPLPSCTTMRRGKACAEAPYRRCLSCGTSLERNGPESLTRPVSEFVHGHISRHLGLMPQNKVAPRYASGSVCLQPLTGVESKCHCALLPAADARAGCGT